ncbi:MAG: transporter ATP-binding protein [Nocardioides sp.]|nr:transporter ATP-binding protein [Nocardioides sp.]
MTGLSVRGVAKSFGGQPVLDGIDLEVPDGITAVLGSSGCGKTTLLRLVAGFLHPDAGSILLDDREVAAGSRSVPARRRGVGYVPQEGALFPHLDVAANIGFGLARSERSGSRVGEVLELVELEQGLAHRFPHELSGGQQQRVALARALAPRPGVVLLDEPFSSLDAGLREGTGRAVARALRASGATGVLVTHDQGEALSLADRVAVMSAGRFLQVAKPSELYLSPASADVAAFVGHALLLPGTVSGETATCALGTVPVRRAAAPGAALLAIRPEQVVVATDGGAAGADAVITEVSFFGHDATVRARLDDGTIATARVPSGSLPAPGDRVRLQVVDRVLSFAAVGGR